MIACPSCSTPVPGASCPTCGAKVSKLGSSFRAAAILGLALGGSTSCVALYGVEISPDADRDSDGFTPAAGDCHDGDDSIFPGAPETAGDGIDSDCDGEDDPVDTA